MDKRNQDFGEDFGHDDSAGTRRAYTSNQPTAPVLTFNPPKFAVEHPVSSDSAYEALMNVIGSTLGFFGQGEIGLISRFGKYYKTTDPGLVYVNLVTEGLTRVDVKIQISIVSSIPIVTKDNVNIHIDAVLYWHIIDPYLATFGVSNVSQALIERSQTTLRSVLGSRLLQDLIENRETIAESITDLIDGPSQQWGVKVESILIKDIVFSESLQKSLSSAATQKRIGQSKVIAAQAEVDSAKLMREAAEILNTPAAMQIRYLETLQAMSNAAGTKVMFVPMSESSGMHGFNAMPSGAPMLPSSSGGAMKGGNTSHIDSGVKEAAIFETLADL
ncbi:putative band 7 family protein [Zancudomyces culisetae]|uniref:Putative band 7 family protein n=1 Tax=Zancudomyces culisetae TaxID=1213189 RepID=A0A1R1PVW9_ZANCU|nr:putative band 7 family protein [Zancudomyces culisetae]|eukprot:OMH85126.1 putative band 7 family protein [Zancudomyces culisetae]